MAETKAILRLCSRTAGRVGLMGLVDLVWALQNLRQVLVWNLLNFMQGIKDIVNTTNHCGLMGANAMV